MTEYEEAYTQGFYSALKGVLFLCEDAKNVEYVVETINEVIEELRKDGDLDNINTGVDELIELTREADRLGVIDEFMAKLDEEIEKRGH